MRKNLQRLIRPGSIAVIGGGVWCQNVIEQCRRAGFGGKLWSVHPKQETFAGLKTHSKVADLPEPPDACFIGVNREATIEIVQHLAAQRAGGAVCFASGFREAAQELDDGEHLEAALLQAAGNMPILGPNCYGMLNYLDGVALWPDQHGGQPVTSGVAIIMQSSNIAINLTMQKRGLPIAYMATVGNQAQIGMSQLGTTLLEDPRVTALGLHIEGIDDLKAFERLAERAVELGKPILALKVGVSEQAQMATISHTASVAGSNAGAEALFARLNVGQARTISGFLEALKLLHVAGPLPSERIASSSCSGGEASLIADTVIGEGLLFPSLTGPQINALRAVLGPKVALSNPLDYHTYIWGDPEALRATFSGLALGDVALVCVILDFPRGDRCDPAAWSPVVEAVIQARELSGNPMAILATLPENMPEEISQRLTEGNVIPLCGLADAVEAIAISAQIGTCTRNDVPALAPLAAAPGRTLFEGEAKTALGRYGLKSPNSKFASSAIEAGPTATAIGFPVALKGAGIAHKSETGAVVLKLASSEAVTNAANQMAAESFLVEEMITDCVAELLIGCVRDEAHGYVLTVAAGGQLTELLQDQASVLIPADRAAIYDALMKLKIAPVLNGYRNLPAADIEAIIDAAMAVQEYVCQHHPAEVEINPLICGTRSAIAVDALIQTTEGTQ